MKLGIIGVGHLAVSILDGLRRAGRMPGDIMLSPRGHGPQMARDHGFALARDTAQIVRDCAAILVAVRPDQAADAVRGLPWREGQIMLSVCAGVPLAAFDIGGATPVRIMPTTAARLGASPTLVYPDLPAVRPLLEAIGAPVPLRSEAEFDAATVSAAMYGWAQALIRTGADWTAAQGMEPAEARRLVARTFTAAGRMIAEEDAPMADILASLCTPGGITRAGLDHLIAEGAPEAWQGACDLVLARLRN